MRKKKHWPAFRESRHLHNMRKQRRVVQLFLCLFFFFYFCIFTTNCPPQSRTEDSKLKVATIIINWPPSSRMGDHHDHFMHFTRSWNFICLSWRILDWHMNLIDLLESSFAYLFDTLRAQNMLKYTQNCVALWLVIIIKQTNCMYFRLIPSGFIKQLNSVKDIQ